MIETIAKVNTIDGVNKKEVQRRDKADKQKEKSEGSTETDRSKKQNDQNDVKDAVDRINKAAQHFNRKIRVEIEKDLNLVIVKVVDGETDEVVRQIPPEELIELSKQAGDLKGLLIDKEG